MGEIEAVETVEEWVFRDLSASTFSDEERQLALDGIDDVSDDLVTWERPIRKVLTQIEHPGERTVYRYRKGDIRLFFIRKGATIYCIGIGKRKTTYDRDLTQISKRSENHPPDNG